MHSFKLHLIGLAALAVAGASYWTYKAYQDSVALESRLKKENYFTRLTLVSLKQKVHSDLDVSMFAVTGIPSE